ncbi:EAL domain-containing protein [Sinorhizobium sp. RAC02]|uniref:putative bifunctional diguanylate cyclase/phosphodiesterase n=1 Tax=Sinorhizobium sp. RAC02 TaxID=1842534 RepID=UPI0008582577|nr:EAL domain-containing protein [Sinorhizobium sp. RAC02]AOF93476.1 diguanylate cyclase domain protein [Sinorhizobium sp. RAC02]
MEDLPSHHLSEYMQPSDTFKHRSDHDDHVSESRISHMIQQNAGSRTDGQGVELTKLLDAYQAALDRHAIVAVTDRRSRILSANRQFCAVSGYREEELVGQPHRLVNSGYHPGEFFQSMWRTIADGQVWHGEICNRAKGGNLYWVDTTIVPLIGFDGRVEAYISVRYDITKRKAAEQALREEVERRRDAEALLVDVMETVPDGIAAFDANDRLVLFNRSYANLHVRSAEAIRIGASFESILRHGLENGQYVLPRKTGGSHQAWLRARLRAHSNPGRSTVQELSDGRWIQIRERRSTSGNTVGTRTDITELKRSESAIKFLAEHDPLTGLLNRSVLSQRLDEAVAACRRNQTGGLLMVMDLDGFKKINDSMGHAAGDALLKTVAQRLMETLRRSDTVVRLGGDEFAVIVPQLGQRDKIDALAQRLLAAIQRSTAIQRRTLTPRLSLGIARFPQDGHTLEALLRKADMALYRAKAEGRGTYRIFTRAMRAHVEQRGRLTTALTKAVARGAIDIALQPQFTLCDRKLTGFEALARWNHEGRPVSPSDFIAIAEESGLIGDLGNQVLNKALEAVSGLRRNGIKTGPVAINIASAQIRHAGFISMLQANVHRHGLRPGDVEIELTENILLDEAGDEIASTLKTLQSAGFSIALDDFGTGYASLSHLGRFPIDRIKIDHGFVSRISSTQDTCTIVRAIIGLAHALGMTVVAEGIETPDQLEQLLAYGCDFGQGYLFSPPLAPDQLATCFRHGMDFAPTAAVLGGPPGAARPNT